MQTLIHGNIKYISHTKAASRWLPCPTTFHVPPFLHNDNSEISAQLHSATLLVFYLRNPLLSFPYTTYSQSISPRCPPNSAKSRITTISTSWLRLILPQCLYIRSNHIYYRKRRRNLSNSLGTLRRHVTSPARSC